MKKIVFLLPLLLAGCVTEEPTLISQKELVVAPPETMYNCPPVTVLPKSDKLTDIEVAKLLVTLHKNNKVCKNSLDAIHTYIDESKKTVEEPKSSWQLF